LLPITAWTVSKDFNGRMWLAQVPALPGSAADAYSQWTDDGRGSLTPGGGFKSLEDGISHVMTDQMQANVPSQSQQQQQMAAAQKLQQQYGTPEGQAALKNMTPDQLMKLAQQMSSQINPGAMAPHAVSPEDQVQLRKIGGGVYQGHAQVIGDVTAVNTEAVKLQEEWDAAAAPLAAQEAAQEQKLPVCRGEAGEPSEQAVDSLRIQFANKRIALAGEYLPKFAPLVGKMRAALLPEIDFGDDAIAAWTAIQDPGLKQQMSATAHGAENGSLADVGMLETLIKNTSEKAARTVAEKKALEKQAASAKGCN